MDYYEQNINLLLNNQKVCYTDEGPDDAPVIIFIHGFPLNKSMWNRQILALKQYYRVIAYDVRGHGGSESRDGSTFSMEIFAHDLICFMDALKIKKASLCGLSMGGYIALNVIENYQHRFESLVLCDTSCFPDTAETIEKRMNTIESIKNNGILAYAESSLKILFAPDSIGTKVFEIESVREMILTTSVQSICNTLQAMCDRKDTSYLLQNIRLPVLILVGEDDIITPPIFAKYMYKKINDSTLHIIKQAGHLSNLENSEDFNKHLITFFELVYKRRLSIVSEGITSFLGQLRDLLKLLVAVFSI